MDNHQVTGNEQALEVAKKMADCLDANFGPEEGKIQDRKSVV